jgi:hypothetical protein
MTFREMSPQELRTSRKDHEDRLASGRGTDAYRVLLANAISMIDKTIAAKPMEDKP